MDQINPTVSQLSNSLEEEGKKLEEKTEELAQELQVSIPGSGLSLPLRIIALFTLAGGISIIGSMFADIINPSKTDLAIYFARGLVGVLAITIAYGIITLKRWSLWLYGGAALIGLAVNPVVALLPILVVVYLYIQRSKFAPSALDHALFFLFESVKNTLLKNKVDKP